MRKIASEIADKVWAKLAEDVEPTESQRMAALFGGPIVGSLLAPEGKGVRTYGHMVGKGVGGALGGGVAGGGAGAGLGALIALLSKGKIRGGGAATMGGGIGAGLGATAGGVYGQDAGLRSGFKDPL